MLEAGKKHKKKGWCTKARTVRKTFLLGMLRSQVAVTEDGAKMKRSDCEGLFMSKERFADNCACVCAKSLQLCLTLCDPMTAAH